MVLVQVALVVGLLALLLYSATRSTSRPEDVRRPAAATDGRWRTGHYDVQDETRVVLQKVANGGAVVDEHVIATIGTADPAYDEMFLAAMHTARQRQALFESEEGG